MQLWSPVPSCTPQAQHQQARGPRGRGRTPAHPSLLDCASLPAQHPARNRPKDRSACTIQAAGALPYVEDKILSKPCSWGGRLGAGCFNRAQNPHTVPQSQRAAGAEVLAMRCAPAHAPPSPGPGASSPDASLSGTTDRSGLCKLPVCLPLGRGKHEPAYETSVFAGHSSHPCIHMHPHNTPLLYNLRARQSPRAQRWFFVAVSATMCRWAHARQHNQRETPRPPATARRLGRSDVTHRRDRRGAFAPAGAGRRTQPQRR
jgi:hypothetical protein